MLRFLAFLLVAAGLSCSSDPPADATADMGQDVGNEVPQSEVLQPVDASPDVHMDATVPREDH